MSQNYPLIGGNRYGKINELPQGYTASECQSEDLNGSLSGFKKQGSNHCAMLPPDQEEVGNLGASLKVSGHHGSANGSFCKSTLNNDLSFLCLGFPIEEMNSTDPK